MMKNKRRGQAMNKDKDAHCSNVTVNMVKSQQNTIQQASSNTKNKLHLLSPTISHLSTQQQLSRNHALHLHRSQPEQLHKNWALMVRKNEHQFDGKMTLGRNCGSTLVCLLSPSSALDCHLKMSTAIYLF